MPNPEQQLQCKYQTAKNVVNGRHLRWIETGGAHEFQIQSTLLLSVLWYVFLINVMVHLLFIVLSTNLKNRFFSSSPLDVDTKSCQCYLSLTNK